MQGPVLKAATDPRLKRQTAAKCQWPQDLTRVKSHSCGSTHANLWLCSDQHSALMSLWKLNAFKLSQKKLNLIAEEAYPQTALQRHSCAGAVTQE